MAKSAKGVEESDIDIYVEYVSRIRLDVGKWVALNDFLRVYIKIVEVKKMSVWIGEEVAKHIECPPEIKVNPNGVDLKVSEIWKIPEDGIVKIHGKERTIEPGKMKIDADEDGFYYLPKGTYEIRVANKVNIPKTAVGLLFPRSTFNRFGVIKSESAVWDSGYSGYGTQTVRITVQELRVHKDEFWFQMMFFDTKGEVNHLYEGHWQGEKPQE